VRRGVSFVSVRACSDYLAGDGYVSSGVPRHGRMLSRTYPLFFMYWTAYIIASFISWWVMVPPLKPEFIIRFRWPTSPAVLLPASIWR